MNPFIVTETRFNSLVERTKRLLLQCGPNAVRIFSRALHMENDFGGSKVDMQTFKNALSAAGLPLTEEEVKTIFARLDRTGAASLIDPTEFMSALRYDFSPLRSTWLSRVWRCFPKDRQGNTPLSVVQSSFIASGHPDVIRGIRTAGEVEEEFIAAFNEDTNPSCVVTRQDFEQYYAALSCTVFDDESYLATLRGCWPIPGVCKAYTMKLVTAQVQVNPTFSAYQEQHEVDQITRQKNLKLELERTIAHDHRPVMLQSALAIRLLIMSLQRQDTQNLTFLSVQGFLAALREHRIYFPNPAVLEMLDTNGDGTVDFMYYLALLMPKLPPTRRMMLERMWYTVLPPKDKTDGVEVLAFQRCFRAKDGTEKSNFYDAWDVQRVVGRKVYLWEVELWYVAQSIPIEVDKDFDSLLTRQWPGYGEEPSGTQ